MTNEKSSLAAQLKILEIYLFQPEKLDDVAHLLRDKLFTTTVNQRVFTFIKEAHNSGKPIDPIILYPQLKKEGFEHDDCAVFSALSPHAYLSPKQITEYVLILFREYTSRYMHPLLLRAADSILNDDPFIEIERLKTAINAIESVYNNVSKEESIKVHFKSAMDRIMGLHTGEIEQLGFSWGLKSLDDFTMGIVQGINVVAGDKGSGKTSLLINTIVENVIRKKQPLLFFSLEMKAIEVVTNVIANIKCINSKRLRKGHVDQEEINSIKLLENDFPDNCVIDETCGITWQYFETKVRSFRRKHAVPLKQTILVLLDYLQLMGNSEDERRNMSKEEMIEQTTNQLMRICKSENIALVLLSQFSREVGKRGNDTYNNKSDEDRLRNFRPRMTDLKGSSAIEANALTILLLFRPEYYRIMSANGKDFRGVCEINVAKGRYVGSEPIYVKFEGKYNMFSDLEEIPDSTTESPF
jgi:replicative DNA helicase